MGGRAHGKNREYQELCRDLVTRLQHRFGDLEPCAADGIDVPFKLGLTVITFDVAMKGPDGRVVVIESKRWKTSVHQGMLFDFAHRIEKLRKSGIEVAGIFMVGKDVQAGTLRAAKDDGIEVVRFRADQPWPNHSFTFLAYDADRERRVSAHFAHLHESIGPIVDHVQVSVSRGRLTVPPIRTPTGYTLVCTECHTELPVTASSVDALFVAGHGVGWLDLNYEDEPQERWSWLCPACLASA